MRLIYLASPYSHPDHDVREQRFQLACAAASRLMANGKHVFSPIAHTHPIALAGDLPKNWEYWKSYDQRMLRCCDEIHVLLLDGWQESVGVAAEMEIAKAIGLPLFYMDQAHRTWRVSEA